MFDNLFSSSATVWAGLIGAMVAIPLLIHLINLMRHQTVRWAAMDFLLKSHKKHRNWVWLKQLLLLLSRIAVLLLALLMLAQIGCQDDRVARLLGGSTTHHYVLLDDSFSMQDRDLSGRAFERATATLSMIAARAKNRQNQKFTLLRYSAVQSASSLTEGELVDGEPDMAFADINAELVDTQFDRRIESVKGELELTQRSLGPRAGLEMVAGLIERRSGENAIVYVLSDFRKRDWERPETLESALAQIESAGAAVELINCVEQANRNLAISRLVPTGSVRVAETPLMVEVEVRNYSDRAVENVQVALESREYAAAGVRSRPETLGVDVSALPAVFIDSIPAGESVKQSFPVYFNQPGSHTVIATLPDDAIATDNTRYCSIEIATSAKVLLVDNAAQLEGRLLSLVLNPGGMTGLETATVTKSFLRDSSVDQLSEYDAVFMLDVDSLDEGAVSNLEAFVADGGGVAFFTGPKIDGNFYREELYRNGQGVFPLPLEKTFDVPERLDGENYDIEPADHPIFAPALSVKNSLLSLVQIKKVWQPPIEWAGEIQTAAVDDQSLSGPAQVLATVRGLQDLPLVVEHRFGNGRAIAVLTTAGSEWNNWIKNATFLPIALLMQDYLAVGKYTVAESLVGEAPSIRVSNQKYQRQGVSVFRSTDERTNSESAFEMTLDADNGEFTSEPRMIPEAGVNETWLTQNDGTIETRRKAFNVDAGEGDLSMVNAQKLVSQFPNARPTMVAWNQFNPEPKLKPASSLNQLLLLLLVGLLIGEQCFAFITNYHLG